MSDSFGAGPVEVHRNCFHRSVAADAGVDSALVHHYFGTKRGLFVAAIALPADPAEVLEPVAAADNEDLGRALATAILGVWDSEDGEAVIAAFRSMIASGDTTLIGTFLLQVALRDVAKRVGTVQARSRARARCGTAARPRRWREARVRLRAGAPRPPAPRVDAEPGVGRFG